MPRIILIVLALFASCSLAQSDQTLVDRFDRMYNSGRYELALKAAEQIVERHPDSAWWRFNTGAVLAKLERPDEAMTHLSRCAHLGFSGIQSFEQNTDLDSLRERADFKEALDRVRANADARMGEFQREAKRHQPKVYVPDGIESPPLIIALHGTGMNGQSMYDALLTTATEMGCMLVCPDALRPAGNGFSWTYRDEAEWFVEYLIDQAVADHDADRDRVILVGFSQGANIALIMGQTRAELFLGTVPICGHYEAQITQSEQQPAPCYLMTGSRDPWRKTYAQAKRDFEAAGGAAEVRMISGKGHELPSGRAGERAYAMGIRWILDQ